MIVTTRYHPDEFRAKIEVCGHDDCGLWRHVWLEFGDDRQLAVLLTVENLRELKHMMDQALAEVYRKPAAVIESIPMFVPETRA